MEKLILARFVRDDVLRVLGEAERSTMTTGGATHPCWRFQATGWSALLSTHWEIACALGKVPNDTDGRDRLLQRARLKLRVGADERHVMTLDYDDDPDQDQLVRYHGGDWERHFDSRRRVLEVLSPEREHPRRQSIALG